MSPSDIRRGLTRNQVVEALAHTNAAAEANKNETSLIVKKRIERTLRSARIALLQSLDAIDRAERKAGILAPLLLLGCFSHAPAAELERDASSSTAELEGGSSSTAELEGDSSSTAELEDSSSTAELEGDTARECNPCCLSSPGGGCGDEQIEACVCAFDDGVTNGSACCTSVWGVYCVAVAHDHCELDCEGCR